MDLSYEPDGRPHVTAGARARGTCRRGVHNLEHIADLAESRRPRSLTGSTAARPAIRMDVAADAVAPARVPSHGHTAHHTKRPRDGEAWRRLPRATVRCGQGRPTSTASRARETGRRRRPDMAMQRSHATSARGVDTSRREHAV
jgi:hypothetical protein